jgi:hypothetical protein
MEPPQLWNWLGDLLARCRSDSLSNNRVAGIRTVEV